LLAGFGLRLRGATGGAERQRQRAAEADDEQRQKETAL
jgi:hypothetical protein